LTETKNILVFIDWYLPGYKAGGPIQSIANLVDKLPHHFWIVTSLFDHNSSTPYEDIEEATWIRRRPNEHVIYFGAGGPSSKAMKSILKEQVYDAIYLNSLFSTTYAIKPLWAGKKLGLTNKIVIAPRGMLKSGALSVKSKKKVAFLRGAKTIGLYSGITWHATNKVEEQEILSTFGKKTKIKIAPNLPRNHQQRGQTPFKKEGEMRLITVARVSSEKNILGGIEFLSTLETGNIEWTIYGTLQDEAYLEKCQKAAAKIKMLTLHFKGEIHPTAIPEALQQHHFFYLPTLGENYGHAIAEAFLSSVPVIISNKTPWQQLEERKAGWSLSLEKGPFNKVLENCLNMDHDSYLTWVEGARTLGLEITNDHSTIQANENLFKNHE